MTVNDATHVSCQQALFHEEWKKEKKEWVMFQVWSRIQVQVRIIASSLGHIRALLQIPNKYLQNIMSYVG